MKEQKWEIIRTKTEDTVKEPVQTMVLLDGVPIQHVQSYSIGQSPGNTFETLLLEIACPILEVGSMSRKDMNEALGVNEVPEPSVAKARPTADDLEFAQGIQGALDGSLEASLEK
jgi:hypothetical protein